MGSPADGRFYERHVWILVFVMGLLLVIFGLTYVAMGLAERPELNVAVEGEEVSTESLLEDSPAELSPIFGQVVRSWGIYEAAFGALVMAVSFVGLRKQQRWAWWTLWLLPVALLAELLNALRADYVLGPLPVFVLIPVVGLLLPVRRFFGTKTGVVHG
jgi:hypothetical protein